MVFQKDGLRIAELNDAIRRLAFNPDQAYLECGQTVGEQVKKPPERTASGAWSDDPMLWPYAAAKLMTDAFFWWQPERQTGSVDHGNDSQLPWTTPNKAVLELPSMRLRDFSRRQTGHATLVCAPYTLHSALIADFAPGHSIVEVLQRGGLNRLHLTDWRSASADMRFLSIDNYLADLNVAIDEIGPPVDLVGLCQGGWLSLIYAARFPQKVRRLVLVGTPVDLSVESELAWTVANAPPSAFEALVSSGEGVVRGDHILRFWHRPPDPEIALQRSRASGAAGHDELLDRFSHWNNKTLDLPATYFRQVVNWIFRENRLATGSFVALGRAIRLARVRTPVFLLVGAQDEVVPPNQALATVPLLGTPAAWVEAAIAPSTHLGLFIGHRTLATSWPQIAAWLQRGEPGLRSSEVGRAI